MIILRNRPIVGIFRGNQTKSTVFSGKFHSNFVQFCPTVAENVSKKYRKTSKYTYPNIQSYYQSYRKTGSPNRIEISRKYFLKQGWPTQIGLWAATWKFCLKYKLFGPHDKKNWKNTPKISKKAVFRFEFGPQKFRVGHPYPKGSVFFLNFRQTIYLRYSVVVQNNIVNMV
jgi:hypothetical protein